MKCISYVSKVTSKANGISVPTGLSEIFRASRKKNAILGVSGILSYRNGYYIQILEGPANSVDQIYEKIKADNRHTNVTLLFETSITERSFPQWSMKLLQSVKKDVDFVRFIEKNSDSITTLNKKRRELLNIFYSNGPTSSRSIDAYSGNNIMLLAWPDLTVIY